MKKVKGVSCYIYVALWMLYYLQEMMMIAGIIAQSVLVVLMVISFYAFFVVNMCYKIGPYLKWLNIMLLVVTIYGLVLFFSGFALYPDEYNMKTGLQFGYLQRIFISVLPIYAFYYFAVKGHLFERNLMMLFFFFLFFSILMYYQNYFLVSREVGSDEITNNIGYRFVPLIFMLALIKMKDAWKYVLLLIVYIFIVMSMKRGAVLVGSIALLLYMKHHLEAKSAKRILYILLLSAVAMGFIYLFIMNFYESSDLFKVRVNSTLEGDTSNRIWMYTHYFDFFVHQTTSLEFLFGCGADATFLKLGEFAHNDWLEFAINQGIFGVAIYVIYWIVFIREWSNFQGRLEFKQTFGDLTLIYFLVSLFSMSFDGMPPAATLCIGYCLAQNEKAKRAQFISEIRNRVLM